MKTNATHRDDLEFTAKELFNQFETLVLDTKQTSLATNQSVITLKVNRANATGIPYIKLGKSVRYHVLEIAKYLSNNTMAVR